MVYASDPYAYRFRVGGERTSFVDRVCRGDFAREVTYGYGRPTRSKPALLAIVEPVTGEALRRQAKHFGAEGVRELAEKLPADETKDELAEASKLADLAEQARRRSKRRRNLEAEARALLERKPALLPTAVADALNISDRRARTLLDKIAA